MTGAYTTGAYTKVTVMGLGYIGLPTAATIATRGIDVCGVDVRETTVQRINCGEAHFAEPDLDILLRSAVTTGKLKAYLEPHEADVFIIAVPTPFHPDRSPDLSYVQRAATAVAKVLKQGDLVILESTCPVGATEQLCAWLAKERPDLKLPHARSKAPDINVAYCPERILPGRMISELVQNDRIVGGLTPQCAERAKDFYKVFVRGEIFSTHARTAEFIKLAENAYRDVNIAFANELSILCDEMKLDPWEVIDLANRHPRVNILKPGAGVGGHCIAVDPWFLISAAPQGAHLMRTAREINDHKPDVVLGKVRRQIERFREPVVACLGLTYKPDVDDLRESPALKIVETLAGDHQVKIIVVEPNLVDLPSSLSGCHNVAKQPLEKAIEKADIILLLVGHKDFGEIRRQDLQERIVIDVVGAWQKL